MSDLQDLPDIEQVVRAALAARVEVVSPTVDTAELTHRIGQAQRQRRYRAVAAAVLAVLVGVGVPVALTRGGGSSGTPPAAPLTPSPAVPTPTASATSGIIRTVPKVSIIGHPYFAARTADDQLVLIDPVTGDQVREINVMAQAGNSELLAASVATFPTGGWLVAARSTTCQTALYRVFADGQQRRVVAGAQIPQIGELAVAPDGRHAAAVSVGCEHSGANLLVIDLASGDMNSWQLTDVGGPTAITGLSWAPDSRHLAYVAGLDTGDGIGGGYSVVDTAAPSASISDPLAGTAHVSIANRSCEVQRGFYVGTSGRFAVVATCPGTFDLEIATVPLLADNPTGALLAKLPGENGSTDIEQATTPDGRNLLITTNDATYRISNGAAVKIGGPWRSPAW